MQLHDYKGCLHIHSTYSDGDASVAEIIAAAARAGLDYIVLTDHDTLEARDRGFAGWHEGVLVLVGAEVHAGRHHCMALGLDHLDGLGRTTHTEEALREIKARGGLTFVVHPCPCHKPLFGVWVPGWDEWDLECFDGLEVWPYLHDWISDLTPWNFLSHQRKPDAWVRGPRPEVLRMWDRCGQKRRVVGIGSLDNHARRFPFRRWHFLEMLPHHYAFRTVRTHLLSPEPFTGDAAADSALVHRLLAEGRCYIAYDLLADPTGFVFEARSPQGPIPMGAQAPVAHTVELRATVPRSAQLRLLRNGHLVAETSDRTLAHKAHQPGVYRLEAYLDGRPWVFSNPVYLREAPRHLS